MSQSRMNPATLMRLNGGLAEEGSTHILSIGAFSGCWPGTIYKAEQLGYLKRTGPAMFRGTARLRKEVQRVIRLQQQELSVTQQWQLAGKAKGS